MDYSLCRSCQNEWHIIHVCARNRPHCYTISITHTQTYLSARRGTSTVIIFWSCEIQNIVVEGGCALVIAILHISGSRSLGKKWSQSIIQSNVKVIFMQYVQLHCTISIEGLYSSCLEVIQKICYTNGASLCMLFLLLS